MRKTKAVQIIEEMSGKGYEYVGMVKGQVSYRSNSNLSRYLKLKGLTEENSTVKVGARAGSHATDGYQLLVFKNPVEGEESA